MTTHPQTPMSRRRLVQGVGALGLGAAAAGTDFLAPATAQAATGFQTRDGTLYDAGGSEFVMRGINHPHAFFPYATGSYAEMSELGANTVRVVLSNGEVFGRTSTSQVQDIIARCKAARLVCVLEVHDTTGYRDLTDQPAGAASLASAVSYWKSISAALKGQERYVIINLGNEPYGNRGDSKVYDWTKDTTAAIKAMRAAGFTHTLIADAPNWGQDWTGTMKEDGGLVLAADPDGNTMLSVHMYEVYGTGEAVRNYLDHFVANRWPLIIGEFGADHGPGKDVNEGAIMTGAQNRGIGYLGWSYSGNSGGVESLDLVQDFDPARLTSWGSTLLNHPAGIRATARRASVF